VLNAVPLAGAGRPSTQGRGRCATVMATPV
jgi:hypothetical protein